MAQYNVGGVYGMDHSYVLCVCVCACASRWYLRWYEITVFRVPEKILDTYFQLTYCIEELKTDEKRIKTGRQQRTNDDVVVVVGNEDDTRRAHCTSSKKAYEIVCMYVCIANITASTSYIENGEQVNMHFSRRS